MTKDNKNNQASFREAGLIVVRTKGLEPPRRKTPDPKSGAATNYATCAICDCKVSHFFRNTSLLQRFFFNLFVDTGWHGFCLRDILPESVFQDSGRMFMLRFRLTA